MRNKLGGLCSVSSDEFLHVGLHNSFNLFQSLCGIRRRDSLSSYLFVFIYDSSELLHVNEHSLSGLCSQQLQIPKQIHCKMLFCKNVKQPYPTLTMPLPMLFYSKYYNVEAACFSRKSACDLEDSTSKSDQLSLQWLTKKEKKKCF